MLTKHGVWRSAALVLVGFGAGYLLGRSWPSSSLRGPLQDSIPAEIATNTGSTKGTVSTSKAARFESDLWAGIRPHSGAERDRLVSEVLAELTRHPSSGRASFYARLLAEVLSVEDLPGVEERFRRELPGLDQLEFAAGFLGAWMSRDPEGLVTHWEKQRRRDPRWEHSIRAACQELVRNDPEHFLQIAGRLPVLFESPADFRILEWQCRAVVRPEETLGRMTEVPLAMKSWVQDAAYLTIGRKDPERLIALFQEARLPADAVGQLAARVLTDPVESGRSIGAEWLGRVAEATGMPASQYSTIALAVAERRPELALQLTESIPASPGKMAGLTTILTSCVAANPEVVRSWIDARTDPEERSAGLSAYLPALVRTDPGQAVGLLSRIDELTVRQQTTTALLQEWSDSAPTAAWTWANEHADQLTGEIRTAVLGQLVVKAPEVGLPAFQSLPEEQRYRELGGLVQRLVQREPASAAQLITSNLEAPNAAAHVSTVVHQWSREDLPSTGAWIDSLPSGTVREKAITTLVGAVDGFDLDLGWRWAAKLADESAREATLLRLGERWLKQDPSAAQTAMANTPLSTGLQTRLQALRPHP